MRLPSDFQHGVKRLAFAAPATPGLFLGLRKDTAAFTAVAVSFAAVPVHRAPGAAKPSFPQKVVLLLGCRFTTNARGGR